MKALIVDDEKHVREGLLLLGQWEKFGILSVLEARDGEEAIDLIGKHSPELIFTDMQMPKKHGIELLKWIYESNISCTTIVLSGYEDYEYMRHAIQYKSFDYLLKPIDPDILNETLEKAVRECARKAVSVKTEPDLKFQSKKTTIHQIEEYLRAYYDQEDLNLQVIADRFFLSKEYVSRKFKQEFGETITDYLMKIRIEKAKELLSYDQLKVYEVAYNVGYQNEKYFSKIFKRVVGTTPMEYKNSMCK